MPFRKLVGSYKDYTLSTHVIEAGYLAVDTTTGDLRIGDGSTPGGTLLASGNISQVGAVTFFGTKLTSPSNGDIEIEPGGTGNLLVQGLKFHDNEISSINSNDNLILSAAGTGQVVVGGFAFPTSDGSNGQALVTDGSGNLSFTTITGGGSDHAEASFTFVGDDSTGTTVDQGETFQIAGGTNITTAVSGDTLTITGANQTGAVSFSGTTLSSTDSSTININEGLIVDGTLTANSISGLTSTTIENTSTGDSLSITTTEDSSTAGPVIMLKRNSSSPADADYLGQLKFKGENDNDQEITYAKVTAKIQDASDGSEDGLLEFANIKAGSQTITARLKSNVFQLLNSTALEVGGYTFPTSDGSAGQVLQTDGSGTISFGTISGVGDLSIIGSSILSPSSADLTLNSSGGNVVVEGLRFAGTTISTEDSSAGVQVAGNLIPSADGVFQLGSASRRWQILYVSAETIDVGGATIKSDGTGAIEIAATGATLPEGSKVVNQTIALNGTTAKTLGRPVQNVPIFVSDGSTTFTDAQLLAGTAALTLEFNATVEDVPVYTEANQTFTLSDGTALANNAAGITLFQF